MELGEGADMEPSAMYVMRRERRVTAVPLDVLISRSFSGNNDADGSMSYVIIVLPAHNHVPR